MFDAPAYPGHAAVGRAYADGVRPLRPEDADSLWLLDFHAPEGLTPLAVAVFEAAMFGSQAAADFLPVPASCGLRGRLWGSHPYLSSAIVASADDRESRAARAAARMPELLAGFPAAWRAAAAELDLRYQRFAAAERRAASAAAARALLADAVVLVRRAWLIHFEFMYPLLEGYGQLLDLARRLDVDPHLVPRLLQGYPTRITQADQALWRLADTVIRHGVADELRQIEDVELRHWLDESPQAVRAEVARVVERFGWRTDAVYEVIRPTWSEDVTPLLQRVRALVEEAGGRAFEDMLRASEDARRAAEADALAGLAGAARGAFVAALERARSANFAWWNEEHNAAIDLRAHVPLRRAARLLASQLTLPDPDLVFFLFLPELEQLAGGLGDRAGSLAAAEQRARLHGRWAAMRPELPGSVGPVPVVVDDPVLLEIFGVGGGPPAPAPADAVLRGLPAAPGRALGRARVVPGPHGLDTLRKGDVLVCEATTPAWTPAFATIAACVCNAGGSLTHAAIVSREYGIPCVTALPRATELIAADAVVEVDGTAGVVRVLAQPATGAHSAGAPAGG